MAKNHRSSSVAKNFIESEVNSRYEYIAPDFRAHLSQTALQFFENLISLDDAISIFRSLVNDSSLIDKLNQIMHMEEIPPQIPQRNDHQKKKSSPWSDYEDLRLITAVIRFGARDWKLIADYVGGNRTSSQCNQRWCRALDPAIIHTQWTPEEDAKLRMAIGVVGNKSWSQVAKIIPGRTDLQCRYRFLQLSKVPIEEMLDDSSSSQKETLPYYLSTDFEPRTADGGCGFLHRLPPLIYERNPKPHSLGIEDLMLFK